MRRTVLIRQYSLLLLELRGGTYFILMVLKVITSWGYLFWFERRIQPINWPRYNIVWFPSIWINRTFTPAQIFQNIGRKRWTTMAMAHVIIISPATKAWRAWQLELILRHHRPQRRRRKGGWQLAKTGRHKIENGNSAWGKSLTTAEKKVGTATSS